MEEDDKLYYSIGEVSEMLDSSTSQLRYWSGEFKLKVRKNRKGDRLFQKKDLIILNTIKNLLKEECYTIDGAKKKLSELKKSDDLSTELPSTNEVKTEELSSSNKNELISKLTSIKMNLEKLKVEIDQYI